MSLKDKLEAMKSLREDVANADSLKETELRDLWCKSHTTDPDRGRNKKSVSQVLYLEEGEAVTSGEPTVVRGGESLRTGHKDAMTTLTLGVDPWRGEELVKDHILELIDREIQGYEKGIALNKEWEKMQRGEVPR